MTKDNPSWIRNGSLFVVSDSQTLDLSQMHFTFRTQQSEVETPNNAVIRLFNLKDSTVAAIKTEFSRVVLQAGYKSGPAGVVFSGQLRQFRSGRLDGKYTYLDLLCADGDTAYNYGFIKQSFAAGSSTQDMIDATIATFGEYGVNRGQVNYEGTGGVLPRGKVLFGLARARLRGLTQQVGATWNISGGAVNITPLDGYLPGEAVVLNSATGLIGRVEQTIDGMQAKCLINPRLTPGCLLQIDNKSINTTQAQTPLPGAGSPQIPFDSYKGLQRFASVAADGIYRTYVVEHEGDSRGQEWYSNIVGLAVNPATQEVIGHG
jgi:hypothetical protein